MNKFYLFLGVVAGLAVCFIVGVKKLRAIPAVDKVEYASVSPALDNTHPVEECQGKKSCLIIYVAPWCGACQMFIDRDLSSVSTALAKKDLGLLIVVGADTPEKNSEHARKLGAIATTDSSGEFMKKNKIEYFPFFMVANSGRVTHHGEPAVDWLNQKMNERTAN